MPPQSRAENMMMDDNNRAVSPTPSDATSTTSMGGAPTEMRRVTSESEISVSSNGSTGGSSRPKSARDYRVRRSSLVGMINWTHVIGTHAPMLMRCGLVLLMIQIVHQVIKENELTLDTFVDVYHKIPHIIVAIKDLLLVFYQTVLSETATRGYYLLSAEVKTTIVILLVGKWLMGRENPVYLMSFATFQAPSEWKVTHEDIMTIMKNQKCFTEESLNFLRRILDRSGTGQATAWPPGIVQCLKDENTLADRSMNASRKEAETILFDIVDNALKRANLHPREIDILIINCSLFSPTPSLCAMVLSHFNMRSDVATYNLSGMGCSASLISIDLAKQLLQTSNRKRKALVVSTEILTPNFYHGNERGFLIQNTLFRCGGAAMILSNNWLDGRRAWYKLLHTVRVQGTGQAAYECVYETEDGVDGQRGVRLSKDLVKVAGKCMEKNFAMMGPLILPWSEQMKVVYSIIARYVWKRANTAISSKYVEKYLKGYNGPQPYVPDFKTCIDHFCIHAGGRAVIDGVEKNMKLESFHTEPSRMTLLNYGNTSSSSIWYELEYIQNMQKTNPLKKGDRILQVAFGSGFKCTSGVWLKL